MSYLGCLRRDLQFQRSAITLRKFLGNPGDYISSPNMPEFDSSFYLTEPESRPSKTSATAEAVMALLLAAGSLRNEVKLVRRTDFDAKPSPATDILKLGGVPAEHSGRNWDAVRGGRTLIAISASALADRALQIMDVGGGVYLEESIGPDVASGFTRPRLTQASILAGE